MTPSTIEHDLRIAFEHHRAGRMAEAIAAFGRVVALRPDSAEAHNNLGIVLRQAGQLDGAIAAYRRALELRSDYGAAHNNLGNALLDARQTEAAVNHLRQAVALAPGSAESQNNLGVALHEAGQVDEALAAFESAVALQPDYALAYSNMGSSLTAVGQLDQALAAYRRALAHRPGHAETYSNILFTLHYHPDHDAQALLAEHRRWADAFAAPLAAQILPHPNNRDPDRKLRVAFVSPDFCGHPVGRLLRPLFVHRDRRHAEFVAYSDVRAPDAVTDELKAATDGWRSIVGMNDSQVAEQIRNDGIDILVDLALHTAHNRMLVFARKPAPVQVTMLGLPATTGLNTIDYRITDPYLDPPGQTSADYTERCFPLPHSFWCYSPVDDSPPVTELPARAQGAITFGCLNQFAKVNRPTLELWIAILQSLEGSRLVLHAPAGRHQDAIRALCRDAGIAADRVEFVARVPLRPYLERYHHLDLCLDPFPCGGGTTTMDALWMGVPVITLAGRTAVGRGGVSILSNVGLTELIARTPEQYVAIARAWGADLERLARVRSALRDQMQVSHLMNGKQFAAEVEEAFRRMWRTWCAAG